METLCHPLIYSVVDHIMIDRTSSSFLDAILRFIQTPTTVHWPELVYCLNVLLCCAFGVCTLGDADETSSSALFIRGSSRTKWASKRGRRIRVTRSASRPIKDSSLVLEHTTVAGNYHAKCRAPTRPGHVEQRVKRKGQKMRVEQTTQREKTKNTTKYH